MENNVINLLTIISATLKRARRTEDWGIVEEIEKIIEGETTNYKKGKQWD